MNTLVAVVLPQWLLWMVVFWLFITCIDNALGIYARWLARKIAKLQTPKSDG